MLHAIVDTITSDASIQRTWFSLLIRSSKMPAYHAVTYTKYAEMPAFLDETSQYGIDSGVCMHEYCRQNASFCCQMYPKNCICRHVSTRYSFMMFGKGAYSHRVTSLVSLLS